MEIARLLSLCVKHQASDLHLVPGQPPYIRIRGDLQCLDLPVLAVSALQESLLDMTPARQRPLLLQDACCDFRWITSDNIHSRVHIYHQHCGMSAAIRLIPTYLPSFAELGLPAVVSRIVDCRHGLVLVTGACGSGKSSTLAAMLDNLNHLRPCHILTLEQPIEFLHVSQRALVSQRELPSMHASLAQALRNALREDPDIIMIGELRDPESIAMALEAAETGHLVLSTLHAGNAQDALLRIIGSFPAAHQEAIRTQLSLSLVAIISQALPQTLDGRRRVLAHEVLLATHGVRNLIRENKLALLESFIQSNQHLGMHTLQQSLMQLVRQNTISSAEARRFSDVLQWQQTAEEETARKLSPDGFT